MASKANTILNMSIFLFVLAASYMVMPFFILTDNNNDYEVVMNDVRQNNIKFNKEIEQIDKAILATKSNYGKRQNEANDLIAKIEKASSMLARISEQEKIVSDPTYEGISDRGTPRNVIKMKATAYDLSVESCEKDRNHPLYGITASGSRATEGRTIAVDPKIIPLGTNVYIVFPEGYKYLDGYYVAEDVGGGIKGKHIDVYMGEDKPGENRVAKIVDKFGVRSVIAYIVDDDIRAAEKEKLNSMYNEFENLLTGGVQ